MPSYVTREEFRALEQEVEGEKVVTRYILEQTRLNGGDLAVIKRQLDGVDLKGLVRDVKELQTKVGTLDAKLTGLIHSLPTMIAEAVREGLKGRRKKD
jgi:hypothetical protein